MIKTGLFRVCFQPITMLNVLVAPSVPKEPYNIELFVFLHFNTGFRVILRMMLEVYPLGTEYKKSCDCRGSGFEEKSGSCPGKDF